MLTAQAEMDAEKDLEKRAKERAELAKYNYKKRKGLNDGFSEIFRNVLLELDPMDTVKSLQRQKQAMLLKYKPSRDDTPEERRHKLNLSQEAKKEWQANMRAAKARERFNDDQEEAEKNQQMMDRNNPPEINR
jgi:hypothetical protein